ncbi:hypothetical protein FALCPG4_014866 [Fusarium falciforme]
MAGLEDLTTNSLSSPRTFNLFHDQEQLDLVLLRSISRHSHAEVSPTIIEGLNEYGTARACEHSTIEDESGNDGSVRGLGGCVWRGSLRLSLILRLGSDSLPRPSPPDTS